MLNLGMDGFLNSLTVTDPLLKSKEPPEATIPDEFIDMLPLREDSTDKEEDCADKEEEKEESPPEGLYRQLSRTNTHSLPEGIDPSGIVYAAQHAGFTAALLGLNVPLDVGDKKRVQKPVGKRGYRIVTLRLILTVLIIQLYFATEEQLEQWFPMDPSRTDATAGTFKDPGHLLMAPVGFFLTMSGLAPIFCCLSVLLSDLSVLLILGTSVLGPTFRPMMSVIIDFIIRLLLRVVGASVLIPPVPDNSWVLPSWWPTLFSRHDAVVNSFYSARVSISTVLACELIAVTIYAKKRSKKLRALATTIGVVYLAFNILISLALKCSWTFDIIVAVAMTRYSTIAGYRMSNFVDSFMP